MSARNPQTLSGAGRVKTPHLCKMLVAALCCAAGFTLVSDGGVFVFPSPPVIPTTASSGSRAET